MGKHLADGGFLPDSDALYTFALTPEELKHEVLLQLMPNGSQSDGIVLQDGESEVVFYLNQLRVAVKDNYVIFDAQLETDQTGVGHLVIPFRIGNSIKHATLTVTTESLPRGNPSLSARWGTIMQEQLWFALLSSGEEIAKTKPQAANLQLSGLYADRLKVVFVYSQPASIVDIRNYINAVRSEGFDSGQEEFDPVAVDLESQDAEPSLCKQVWRELYELLLQLIRFARKFIQLSVYFIRKLINRFKR